LGSFRFFGYSLSAIRRHLCSPCDASSLWSQSDTWHIAVGEFHSGAFNGRLDRHQRFHWRPLRSLEAQHRNPDHAASAAGSF
jgi:hypothetical protein